MSDSATRTAPGGDRAWYTALLLAAALYAQPVSVKGGAFTMGGPGGDADESPAHSVMLSGYKIDSREVTVAQYDSCVRRGACTPAHYDDTTCLVWAPPVFRSTTVPSRYRSADYPVVCVTWSQARDYCRSRGMRLPTEAEWERAALAGTSGTYSWGSALPSPALCTPAARQSPCTVGSYAANGWGLYDMTGNVWEWVNDWYQVDYYRDTTARANPPGPEVGRYRVIRGGGWYGGAAQLRIRNRSWFAPEFGEVSIGFRCAR